MLGISGCGRLLCRLAKVNSTSSNRCCLSAETMRAVRSFSLSIWISGKGNELYRSNKASLTSARPKSTRTPRFLGMSYKKFLPKNYQIAQTCSNGKTNLTWAWCRGEEFHGHVLPSTPRTVIENSPSYRTRACLWRTPRIGLVSRRAHPDGWQKTYAEIVMTEVGQDCNHLILTPERRDQRAYVGAASEIM